MSMSKRDYVSLANTLGLSVAFQAAANKPQDAALMCGAAYQAALGVADALGDSSPRYDRARFIAEILRVIEREAERLGGDYTHKALRVAAIL